MARRRRKSGDGSAGGGLGGWLRKWRRRLVIFALLAAAGLGAFMWHALKDLPDVKSAREGTLVLERETASGKGAVKIRVSRKSPHWVPLNKISPFLVEAVVTAEDDLFYEHEGFNFEAIKESAEQNLKRGKYARGGSTITQQLAKNLFLSRKKTLTRKLQEAWLAFWIERKFTKNEILETYLNIVEWGPDLYGIGPAAKHYFDKRPADLGPRESAFLAVMLPSPKKRHAWATDPMDKSALKLIASVLQRMNWRGAITDEEYKLALRTKLQFSEKLVPKQPAESAPESLSQETVDP